jgi:hypothetical protein
MKTKPFLVIGFSCVLCSFFLSSCATYHITTHSLLEQFASRQKETKVNYIVAFPIIFPGKVTGNSLRTLNVLDSKEQEKIIQVTHRTGIRITNKNGQRNTFYFDTLLIQDSTITGKKDHFFGINAKPINLNHIQKMEVQE